jgi:hypothetical protein
MSFGIPGWAAFMTQNTDRAFSNVIREAVAIAESRRPSRRAGPVTWEELHSALRGAAVRKRLLATHGSVLVDRLLSCTSGEIRRSASA